MEDHDYEEDIDYRQKFYELMSQKIASEEKEVSVPHLKHHPLRLYRRLALNFLFLAVVFLAVVTYYSLMSLTVEAQAKKEALPGSFVFKVCGQSDCQSQGDWLKGVILKVEVETEKEFLASGQEALAGGFRGRVRLINKTNKDQPLVKTTRVLSLDGKLFRLNDNVVVRANSEISANVYPDKDLPEMAIPATSFTIPGLNSSLQKSIYAQSDEAFSYSSSSRRVINEADFERAKKEISSDLLRLASEQLNHEIYDSVAFRSPESTIKAEILGAKVGDLSETFRLRAKNVVQAAHFSLVDLEKSLKEKVSASLPLGQELKAFDSEAYNFQILSYDEANDTASIKVDFSSLVSLGKQDLINREALVDLSAKQIEDYLRGEGRVENFKLHFYPGFIKKAPCSANKIKIEIY